jgi:predicted transcriptional regulator
MSPTSVALPAQLRARLDLAARKLRRKKADVMRLAIEQFVDEVLADTPKGGTDAETPTTKAGKAKPRVNRRR